MIPPLASVPPTARAVLQSITDLVGPEWGVTLELLRSTGRTALLSEARHAHMFLAHEQGTLNVNWIAAWLHRDHCTVWHSCRVVRDRMSIDIHFRERILYLQIRLQTGSPPGVPSWRRERPTVADLAGKAHAYYWARGGNFNRPIIVLVHNGTRARMGNDAPRFQAELNFCFEGRHYPEHLWSTDPEWQRLLDALEWAGPIPEPPQ